MSQLALDRTEMSGMSTARYGASKRWSTKVASGGSVMAVDAGDWWGLRIDELDENG